MVWGICGLASRGPLWRMCACCFLGTSGVLNWSCYPLSFLHVCWYPVYSACSLVHKQPAIGLVRAESFLANGMLFLKLIVCSYWLAGWHPAGQSTVGALWALDFPRGWVKPWFFRPSTVGENVYRATQSDGAVFWCVVGMPCAKEDSGPSVVYGKLWLSLQWVPLYQATWGQSLESSQFIDKTRGWRHDCFFV